MRRNAEPFAFAATDAKRFRRHTDRVDKKQSSSFLHLASQNTFLSKFDFIAADIVSSYRSRHWFCPRYCVFITTICNDFKTFLHRLCSSNRSQVAFRLRYLYIVFKISEIIIICNYNCIFNVVMVLNVFEDSDEDRSRATESGRGRESFI